MSTTIEKELRVKFRVTNHDDGSVAEGINIHWVGGVGTWEQMGLLEMLWKNADRLVDVALDKAVPGPPIPGKTKVTVENEVRE